MTHDSALNDIEKGIQQATVLVEFGSAISRLTNNKDFKRVIGEGYFEQEAIRLVHLKADENMQSVQAQASIVKQMDAIGALGQFLQTKQVLATQAARSIAADEETRDELLAEDLNHV